jgi:hypothetical protein
MNENTVFNREGPLTPEEQIQVNQLKWQIREQLVWSKLSWRVQKSIAILLDWNHLRPTVWQEISSSLWNIETSTELIKLLDAFGPLMFAIVSKADITGLRADAWLERANTAHSSLDSMDSRANMVYWIVR